MECNARNSSNSNDMDECSVPLGQEYELKSVNVDEKVNVEENCGDNEKEGKPKPGYKMKGLVYGVDDRPPFQIAIVCAFQVGWQIFQK